MNRRRFLMGSTLAGAALAAAGCATMPTTSIAAPVGRTLYPGFEDLQRKTFDWFVHVTNRRNGLTPDRWPTESFSSVAAVGFALTCWPIGVERGWMSREEARERTLTTIRFFHELPQGPEPTGNGGYKGFFYHFINMETGHRFGTTELSTVDTALLIAGMLFAARWFDGDHPAEREIRERAQAVYERVEWDWAVVRPNRITMGWHPETGFIPADWNVYNEGMVVLLLAIGSPTHPAPTTVWDEWCSVYDHSWTDRWGPKHLHFAPLFGHEFSHMYIDFRGIHDQWMRDQQAEMPGFDYFQNSVRAVEAQRKYAVDNPMGWAGYSQDVWGLTACDGPGDFRQVIDGREREFFSYSARGPGDRDDGTIAPTAALASLPFAPDHVLTWLNTVKARYGAGVYTRYGFLDAFNPTLTERDGPLQHGKILPGIGWVADDYLGIDQGPIVIQIENHRSEIVWKAMHGEPNLIRGLKRAGFTGGWLDNA
ncbi:glucoamylase family protein [Brevundimonas sp. GCM10030266]|uniref:glucoamylase family protein n=1 Tax=Brevundimonas sp. GCM10030266 TaxID=3273386 RepID=UPI0036094CA2